MANFNKLRDSVTNLFEHSDEPLTSANAGLEIAAIGALSLVATGAAIYICSRTGVNPIEGFANFILDYPQPTPTP